MESCNRTSANGCNNYILDERDVLGLMVKCLLILISSKYGTINEFIAADKEVMTCREIVIEMFNDYFKCVVIRGSFILVMAPI